MMTVKVTMNTKKLRVLLSLFVLNTATLYLYFYFSHPDYFRRRVTENRAHFQSSVKPWPNLPSYFPWSSQNRDVPVQLGSCEAYFGNGFTRRVDALEVQAESNRKLGPGGGGWFRCFYSDTLQSSVCEGGRIRMNVDRIRMSRGGEKLATVIGRGEEEELPDFEAGAFEIEVMERDKFGKKLVDEEFLDNYVPSGAIDTHTMRGLVDSIRMVGPNEFECAEVSKF